MKILSYLFLFFFTVPLLAGEFQADETVIIENTKESDVYAAGSNIQNTGKIPGDFTAAGGTIMINAPVGADLNITGGDLFMNAPVKDDVRMAGGNLQVNESIGGDAILAGGNINISGESKIAGDLMSAGGKIRADGNIAGKAMITGGEVVIFGDITGPLVVSGDSIEINGDIRGDTKIRANHSIKIGPDARFHGSVRYWIPSGNADFGESVLSGSAVFDPSLELEQHGEGPGGVFFALLLFGSSILAIGLLIYLFPGFFQESGSWLPGNPASALGVGLLYFFATPVLALVLLILVIGIPLGLLTGAVYGFSIVFALPLSSTVFAFSLRTFLKKEWKPGMSFIVAMGIYIILSVISLIPILGWLIVVLAVFAGTGSILANIVRVYRTKPADAPMNYSI